MTRPRVRPWSCDTFVVHGSGAGASILGKNSDRPAREAQPLHRVPRGRGGGPLQLAYVSIDDAPETLAHLGSSPYWCWGHEMGLNEAGLAIGNEALFTRGVATAAQSERDGRGQAPGILGMELVRIALERAHSASEAVSLMGDLIERYGQWGAGTVSADRAASAYDNSYLLADCAASWVLETSGRRWVAREVTEPSYAISNEATVRTDWDRGSSDLVAYACAQGWTSEKDRFDFAEAYSDPNVPLQVSHIRLQRSRELIAQALDERGSVTFADARRVLSDHYEDTFLGGPKFNPARPDFHTLCMHAHPSGFTWGNTAASMIAVLPKAGTPYIWWAPATPCTSVYVPVAVDGPALPDGLSQAGTQDGRGLNPECAEPDTPTQTSYWWAFQTLLESVAGDPQGTAYHKRHPVVRRRLDPLQQRWLREVDALEKGATTDQWSELTSRCVAQAWDAAQELRRDLAPGPMTRAP
jgi:secernin